MSDISDLTLYITHSAVLIAALIAAGLVVRFKNAKKRLKPARLYSVGFDENQLTVTIGGETREWSWRGLEQITLHASDLGPFIDDQTYEFDFGVNGSLNLPSELNGMKDLVEGYLLKIKGLDHKSFIDAMGCTDNQSFKIYMR